MKPVRRALLSWQSTIVGDVTVTTTSQVLRINTGGGRTDTAIGFCGRQCKVTVDGGTLGQCKTSGCAPAGKSCTPLVCSGSCRLDRQCKRELTIGVFSAGGIQ